MGSIYQGSILGTHFDPQHAKVRKFFRTGCTNNLSLSTGHFFSIAAQLRFLPPLGVLARGESGLPRLQTLFNPLLLIKQLLV